mmetsp:Transcript_61424/g.187592  ORF Transcript_61424/g.187592 Transcript_61424/m.187592 type:complete len:295 (-) Transcript_61424:230-1114(-)
MDDVGVRLLQLGDHGLEALEIDPVDFLFRVQIEGPMERCGHLGQALDVQVPRVEPVKDFQAFLLVERARFVRVIKVEILQQRRPPQVPQHPPGPRDRVENEEEEICIQDGDLLAQRLQLAFFHITAGDEPDLLQGLPQVFGGQVPVAVDIRLLEPPPQGLPLLRGLGLELPEPDLQQVRDAALALTQLVQVVHQLDPLHGASLYGCTLVAHQLKLQHFGIDHLDILLRLHQHHPAAAQVREALDRGLLSGFLAAAAAGFAARRLEAVGQQMHGGCGSDPHPVLILPITRVTGVH